MPLCFFEDVSPPHADVETLCNLLLAELHSRPGATAVEHGDRGKCEVLRAEMIGTFDKGDTIVAGLAEAK